MDKKERNRLYRLNNPEKFKAYDKKYKEQNPEKYKEARQRAVDKWKQNNPEKYRQQNLARVKKYYEKVKHTPEFLEKRRKYATRQREKKVSKQPVVIFKGPITISFK